MSDKGSNHSDEDRFAIAEAATGHVFADRSLLRRALTHPSFKEGSAVSAATAATAARSASRKSSQPSPAVSDDYERLEFLGDAVISLVVTDELFARFPGAPEGTLTKLKTGAVSGRSLGAAAEELGLADALFMGQSELGTGGRGLASALENVFEALVAALYLDAGYERAREFVSRALRAHIGQGVAVPAHPKSDLQEYLQARGGVPVYRLVDQQGPPHDRTFTVMVIVDGEEAGTGVGRSKKEAEMRAAAAAIEHLGLAKGRPAVDAD